jgi:hypothetical protein
MAYDGELVKLGNGRWAKFTQCRVASGAQESILVAVELDDEAQTLLHAAESSFEALVARGYSYAADLAHTPLTTGEQAEAASFPGDIGSLH